MPGFTPPQFLRALLNRAYFPTELPPVVTAKYFSEFCRDNYASLRTDLGNFLRLTHPLSQLGLSLAITQNRGRIRQIISSKPHSVYSPDENPSEGRAFAGLDFRRREIEAARIGSQCEFVLRADISRFFYTAYTHSFQWAVLGKARAKEMFATNRAALRDHWSASIDMALQSCQSRETFGIPVGPDTSRVVAEILLAGGENESRLAQVLAGRPMVRVVDDYLIGFDTEQAARTALARLREALWSFNLQLNDQKTGIFRSSTVHREKWQLDFDYIKLAARNIEQQRRDIDHLNELALYHCNATNSERPAIWACRRIAELRYDNRNLGLILDVLFRLSRDFPSCVSHVVEFLINNQARCGHPEHIPRVTSWLMHMISSHIQQFHDAEAAWCLVAAGVFQLHLTERELHPDQGRPGPIVFAIIGLLTAWTGELSAFQVAVARGLQAGGPPLSTLVALIRSRQARLDQGCGPDRGNQEPEHSFTRAGQRCHLFGGPHLRCSCY